MKKIYLLIILISLLTSCEKREFNNLFDPGNPSHISEFISDFTVSKTIYNKLSLQWHNKKAFSSSIHISRKVDNEPWQEDYQILESDKTFFMDNQVTGNRNYTYKLSINFDQNTICTDEKTCFLNVAINTVSNITSQLINWNTVKLSWNLTGDETCMPESIFISRIKDNQSPIENYAVLNADSTVFIDHSVDLGHSYVYKFKGRLGSAFSDYRTFTLTQNLISPSNLNLNILSENEIRLTWNYNYQATGFIISRKVDSGEWDEDYATINLNKKDSKESYQFIDSNALFNHFYGYKVRTVYQFILSEPVVGNITHKLKNPFNLHATIIPNFNIKLNWSDDNIYHTGYSISRKKGDEAWQDHYSQISPNLREWTDSDIDPLITYAYRLYAVYNQDLSDMVQCSALYPLDPPTNLSAVKINNNCLKLSWQPSPQNVESYNIYRKVNNDAWTLLTNVQGSQTDFSDQDVVMLTNVYFYKMTSVYHNIESVYSAVSNISPDLILIPAGLLEVNSNLTAQFSSFYIGSHEVTEMEWFSVMGYETPGNSQSNKPVSNITWLEAVKYCNKKSMLEGFTPCYTYQNCGTDPSAWGNDFFLISCNWTANGYRLPTEMEWMYAANEANQNFTYSYSGSSNLNDVGWYINNSNNSKQPVITKAPNSLNIFDMSGNISEWCWDFCDNYPQGSVIDYRGPVDGLIKIHRGGSFSNYESVCNLIYRSFLNAENTADYIGFRIARNTLD